MTKNTPLGRPLTAFAALAILLPTAHAATLVNGTTGSGELFIGFRVGSNPGLNNVVFEAGAVATLAAAAPGTVVTLGNLGADLVNQYGPTWFERTDLTWGAAAGNGAALNGDASNTLYGGVSATGLFPLATGPYTRQGSTAQGSIVGQIMAMASNTQGFTTAATGASSNIAIEATTDLNSWSSKVTGTSSFGDFTLPAGQEFEQAFSAGALTGTSFEGALDVYRMYRTGVQDPDAGNAISGGGSYQFTLGIDSNGIVTASVLPLTPVPEPSSFGALAALALLGTGVFQRRRFQRA